MKLEGNVAIVTGGAGGLGEATVRAVLEHGGSAVIADLDDDRGTKLEADLGDRVRYVRTDVLDDSDVNAAITAAQELGTLRYTITAHGGFGVAQRIVQRDGTPADWDGYRRIIDLYLNGTYNVMRLTAAAIARNEPGADGERGAIITTASIAAFEGQVGQSAYAAAKGGVVGLTLAAARDLAAIGVRVSCIAPGTMRTPAMEQVGEEALAVFSKNVPFPSRLGQPAEYGSLAVYLLTNPYINGETIRLDGGQRFQPR